MLLFLGSPALHADDPFFPAPPGDVAFDPYRTSVYSASDLLKECATNSDPNSADIAYHLTLDWRCYTNVMIPGTTHKQADLPEATRRFLRLHDLAIEEALDNYIHASGPKGPKKIVGIMGGHDILRQEKTTFTNSGGQVTYTSNDAPYMQIALLAQALSSEGFTIATGGGPGAMEAGNLGAWFAGRPDKELRQAVRTLATVPSTTNTTTGKWLLSSFQVIHDFPRTNDPASSESIGVPTWFYGFEPPNPFATHIAKYFDNSLREEHLLAISTDGVIFAPGGAGTVQEIFQDACQNYYNNYATKHFRMVLLGSEYWNPGTNTAPTPDGIPIPAWPALHALAAKRGFGNLVVATNDVNAIVKFIAEP